MSDATSMWPTQIPGESGYSPLRATASGASRAFRVEMPSGLYEQATLPKGESVMRIPEWAAVLATVGAVVALGGAIGRLLNSNEAYSLTAAIGLLLVFVALSSSKSTMR